MKKFASIALLATLLTMPVAFASAKTPAPAINPVVVTTAVPVESASKEMTVKARVLNVRAEAKIGKNLVGHLKKGAKVTVEKVEGKWAQIQFKGKTAYVAVKYLK